MKDKSPIRFNVLGLPTKLYRIAFVNADGSWDIKRKFFADNDATAKEYADEHFANHDWYVLDEHGHVVKVH